MLENADLGRSSMQICTIYRLQKIFSQVCKIINAFITTYNKRIYYEKKNMTATIDEDNANMQTTKLLPKFK